MNELILGGQRSGKSRCAEQRAALWLARSGHTAVLLATALGADDEMRARIARHRQDRAERAPGLQMHEVPIDLAAALAQHSTPACMVIADCLTLWLTNLLMPVRGDGLDAQGWATQHHALCAALAQATGPVLLVSNEIGMGIAPLTPQARRFVDELGRLHQSVAAWCSNVTLMVAGIEVPVKRGAA